jgi:hypothetical protein
MRPLPQHQHRGPSRLGASWSRFRAAWGGGSGGSRDNYPVHADPIIGVGSGDARPAMLPLGLKPVGYAYVLGVELEGEKKLLECRHHLSCRQKIMIISIKTAFYSKKNSPVTLKIKNTRNTKKKYNVFFLNLL